MNSIIFAIILLLGFTTYYFGKKKALLIKNSNTRLTALPKFYGYYLAIWCAIPAFIIFSLWSIFEPTIVRLLVLTDYSNQGYLSDELNLFYEKTKALSRGLYSGEVTIFLENSVIKYQNLNSIAQNSKIVVILAIIIFSTLFSYKKISNNHRTREPVEKFLKAVLFTASLAAILTTLGIVFSLIFETIRFFKVIPLFDFIFGTHWYPAKTFVRDASAAVDPDLYKDAFGSVPLFAGTFFIAFIAMCVAIPIGLLSGIYLSEYASKNVRKYVKPLIEILAGIPTVVYGFFAALTVGPFLREIGISLGLEVSSESALAAGAVMGIMIIPFISSLSDDVITSVPQSLRDGSYAMGATKSETIKKVIFPAALPGIVGSILLGVSRAIGETMIVVMASGLAANLTFNPLESTSTITAQIVVILIGDQQFGDPKTQAAFALGMTLFLVTLCLNIFALKFVKKYREKYE
ncbi:MAG: phosphate ABC transporter permease subunit PstC [Candidatus Pelagibacter sp.]|nr:phosphate ABC transporter permease subunit PstC [Candidatus Pelagibacter sp.]